MAPILLGPPELQNPTETTLPSVFSGPRNPFMDLMVSRFNKTTVLPKPTIGKTVRESPTYISSCDPCLDFFFHVVPDTKPESLKEKLLMAWSHDPLKTLKLIFNLRGIRGTGKGNKEGFYTAVFWLHSNHPKTLASNLDSVAKFGYFKDLPEILYRLLNGPEVRENQKMEWSRRKNSRGGGRRGGRGGGRGRGRGGPFSMKQMGSKGGKRRGGKSLLPREIRIANALKKNQFEKMQAKNERERNRLDSAKKAILRYAHDSDYRYLYERITDLFAEYLTKDLEVSKSGDLKNISLAAKWCPSPDSSFDRATLMCESIGKKMFPRESYLEYKEIQEAHYAYRVRDRLRKEVLVPLRKALELPEVYMSEKKWGSIPYHRVPSLAMKMYKEKFVMHDRKRFSNFLQGKKMISAKGSLDIPSKDVKPATVKLKKIAAGGLLPHEIIKALDDDEGGIVAELQWNRMVEDLLANGKMRNCIAVCGLSDVSDYISLALGLLLSELSEDPWKGKLITFGDTATLEIVQGLDLKSKFKNLKKERAYSCDIQNVFDLILKVAVEGELKREDMVKRVFVFSDMDFSKASDKEWETDYQVIVDKFHKKGYAVPQIIFWNLTVTKAMPVVGSQNGTALVSGFSMNMFKILIDTDAEINPISVMDTAISGEEYEKLIVID